MESQNKSALPPIPEKRYFTIGEASELCGVKSHVLRYWEQEFNKLKPMKRRGNRRYYQRHDIELVRKIRELLYDDGFTIQGAKAKLEREVKSTKKAVLVEEKAFLSTESSNDYAELISELETVLQVLKR